MVGLDAFADEGDEGRIAGEQRAERRLNPPICVIPLPSTVDLAVLHGGLGWKA